MSTIEPNNSGTLVADENSGAFELGYEPTLDGLRGLAIIVVMAFNGHFLWMEGGFVGVDIFFVLSGFLITSLLVQSHRRTSGLNLKNFYLRRALRLLPALFLLMLFCIGYAVFFQPADKSTTTLRGVFYTFFYINNWVQISDPGLGALSHAWSLSVEEQFYIAWPLFLLILLKVKNKAWIFAILFALICVSFAINAVLWSAKASYLRLYFGSDTRAYELLIGCVTALLLSWGIVGRRRNLKWVFHIGSLISIAWIFLMVFVARHTTGFVYNGGFALVCIGTAILIMDLLLFPSGFSKLFEFRPLVWIGKISYGLYLWHYPIFEASKLLKDRMSPLTYGLIGLVVTFLVAIVSYYLVEQPFLKLRRRYSETKSRPASESLSSYMLNTADAEAGRV
jgi:peptidoglycan/LPS O-acetylase OafA/YrhL